MQNVSMAGKLSIRFCASGPFDNTATATMFNDSQVYWTHHNLGTMPLKPGIKVGQDEGKYCTVSLILIVVIFLYL